MANITKEAGTIKFKGLVDIQEGDNPKQTDVDITTQGEWSSNQDWASIDNNGLVTYEENTGEQRTAIITLKYQQLTDTEELVQETGKAEPVLVGYSNPVISAADDSEIQMNSIPAAGGELKLKCLATANYDDESTKENIDITNLGKWKIAESANYVTNSGNIYTIQENTTISTRNFYAQFLYDEYSLDTRGQCTQLAAEDPQPPSETLDVKPTFLEFEPEGGTQTITVTSNTDWTVE